MNQRNLDLAQDKHHHPVDRRMLEGTQTRYHFVQQTQSKNEHQQLHMRMYKQTMNQHSLYSEGINHHLDYMSEWHHRCHYKQYLGQIVPLQQCMLHQYNPRGK